MKNIKNLFIEKSIHLFLLISVSITILTTLAVIVLLGKESIAFFSEVSIISFLFGTNWSPLIEPQSFGVLPLVCGTMWIVFGSVIFAVPVGLLVAVYLSEYASDKVKSFLKPILELLAGIPTVVYGYFALTFITPLMKWFNPEIEVFNAASGAIVVGIMILPMIASLCDDAFSAVPSSIKQGGYALGANTFEVIKDILIPATKSRIGAATVLAVSRAIGETMAVTLAAGATARLTGDPFGSIQTMTAYIVQVTMGDAPAGGVEYLSSFAVGTLLFLMTLVMNIIGNQWVFKSRIRVV